MYKEIGSVEIGNDTFGFGDTLSVDFNEKERVLRVTVFSGSHYQDDTCVRLMMNGADFISGEELWKHRCQDMAAHVDELEEYIKELEERA